MPVQRIDFGERVTRAEAERRAGLELVDVGDPDSVFVREDGLVSLVYGPVEQPRLVLSQARGGLYEGFLKKVGGSGTRVETRRGRR